MRRLRFNQERSPTPTPYGLTTDGLIPEGLLASGLVNRLQARLAGLSRQAPLPDPLPEPRSSGAALRGRWLTEGQIRLGGIIRTVDPGQSPFGLTGLAPQALAELHGFAWLDDLAALGGARASQLARAWIGQWIRLYGRGAGPGWSPALTGQRLVHWLDNALFVLSDASPAESLAWRRALGRQAQFLARRWPRAPAGQPRIMALAGVILLGQTLPDYAGFLPRAARALGPEVAGVVNGAGGIASRNPEELLELFALLTRLARALTDAGQAPSEPHLQALTQMAPLLRTLRHADGSLARFHGGDAGEPGRLDEALALAGLRSPPRTGLAMGYLRLSHGRTTVILDAAAPPTGTASALAQASTLGFELTSGRRPLIISAGPGQLFGPDWYQAARATASASTVELLDNSSSRLGLTRSGELSPLLAEVPGDVREQKTTDENGTEAVVSHDGYVVTHGLTHMRRLTLSADGRAVLGEDRLAAVRPADQQLFDSALAAVLAEGRAGPASRGIPFAIRFHLHPDVTVKPEPGGSAVQLTLASGETWLLRHDGVAQLSVGTSVWLSRNQLRPLASKQVVLTGAAMDYASRVRWSLAKAPDAPLAVRDLLRSDDPWSTGPGA